MPTMPRTVLPLLLLVACTSSTPIQKVKTCQNEGQALARAITEDKEILLEGPHAIGGQGDYILQNDLAAFIIQGVDRGISYYHYGGIAVDAVAMDRCTQISPDQFEEAGLLLGNLELGTPYNSSIRAFRAQSVEVLNDGTDGKAAIVRAIGVDDYYWLVEYTLVELAFKDGADRPLSDPYGLRIVVDYILPPDSRTLQIQITYENTGGKDLQLLSAAELIFGDETELSRYAGGELSAGGFDLATAIPWITNQSNDGRGAYAVALLDANAAYLNISGVDILFNLNNALSDPIDLPDAGASQTVTFLLAAGPTDGHSAAQALAEFGDQLDDSLAVTRADFTGTVVDGAGQPVAAAQVELQASRDGEIWQTLDRYIADAAGTFGAARMDLGPDSEAQYRMRAFTPDRGYGEPVALTQQSSLTLTLGAHGTLNVSVRDAGGADLPGKLSLYQNDVRVQRFFVVGSEALPVPPGTYDYSFTRGFEYEPVTGSVTVPDDGAVSLTATMVQSLDTTGYLSIDTHVHSGPSADSKIPLPLRIRDAAAEHLEIPVATDHEAITGLRAGIDATGLHAFVNTITGEEVTATLPQHLTMFPVVPDGSLRGGIIKWYKLGLPELFEAMYARGAQIAMINHPGSTYENLRWDRVAGAPGVGADYPKLHMEDSKAPWSWNFDGIEVMNGYGSPFRKPGDNPYTGHFDNWMSFHNHGHRIVGVGCSDTHGLEDIGQPRSYFKSPTDKPIEFRDSYAVDAFKKGQVMLSAGAFAEVTVNGAGLGALADETNGVADVAIEIRAIEAIDVTHLRVYRNCDEVLKINTTNPNGLVKYSDTVTVPVSGDSTIVVAAFGANNLPRGLMQYDPRNVPRVMTNPIYVDTNGDGDFDAPGGKECSYTLD